MPTVICIMSSLKVKHPMVLEKGTLQKEAGSLYAVLAGLEPAIHTNKLPLNSEVCAHLCL